MRKYTTENDTYSNSDEFRPKSQRAQSDIRTITIQWLNGLEPPIIFNIEPRTQCLSGLRLEGLINLAISQIQPPHFHTYPL